MMVHRLLYCCYNYYNKLELLHKQLSSSSRHLQKTVCSVFNCEKLLTVQMDCEQQRRVKTGAAAGRKHAKSSGDVSYHPSEESEKGTERPDKSLMGLFMTCSS